MRTKPWIIFITLFSAVLFCIIPPRSSRGCAGGYDPEDEFTSFLNTDLLDSNSEFRHWDWGYAWNLQQDNEKLGQAENIRHWIKYLKLENAEKDVEYLVYNSTIGELDTLKTIIKSKQALPEKFNNNIAIKQLWNKKQTDVIDYIHALRVAAPITNERSNYWEEYNPNTAKADTLCKQAKSAIKHVHNGFLKERYAYQAIRLAKLAGNPQEAVNLYKKYIKTGKKIDLIDYWSMSYAAGAYLSLGDSAKAAYMFSRLYELCPSRKQVARSSFKISTDENWEECLSFCKNDHEKAQIWLLAGNTTLMPELECMNSAYKLNEPAASLEPLLAQDMYNHDQKDNRTSQSENDYYNPLDEKPVPETSIALTDSSRIAFYNQVANDNATQNKTPWLLAIAYLQYENKDYKKAEEVLKNIKAGDKKIQDQKDILLSVIILDRSVGQSDENLEKELLPHLGWIDNRGTKACEDARKYIFSSLSTRYKKEGLDNKALAVKMMISDISYLQDCAGMSELDSLLAFQKKTGKSDFEKFLEKAQPSRSSLMEIKGTAYLAQLDLVHALACFQKVDEPMADLQADPFMIRNKDCHDCDYEDKNKTVYNKLTLVKAILKLESDKDKYPGQAVDRYFKLANAYYNLTDNGNSWSAIRYSFITEYLCGNSPNSKEKVNPDAENGNKIALRYYMKAKELSNDREFQAKCVFMAAKCELNIAYLSVQSGEAAPNTVEEITEIQKKKQVIKNDDDDTDDEDGDLNQKNDPFDLYLLNYFGKFNLLINQYSDTKYYHEVIEECTYLQGYKAGEPVSRNERSYY